MLFLLLWMLFPPLSSALPANDSTPIASEVIGTTSIDAYEGGDEEDCGGDNMEPSIANDNEFPSISENGSDLSMAQENDTPSTQIPPNLPRKENFDSESPSSIVSVTFAFPNLFKTCILVLTFITIGMTKFTFITLNCRGLCTADHRATLFQWVNCAKTDFVCLQKTHSISGEGLSSWLDHATSSRSNKFGYKCISSSGTILSCGVAILCNRGYDVVSCSLDQEGRLLCQGW